MPQEKEKYDLTPTHTSKEQEVSREYHPPLAVMRPPPLASVVPEKAEQAIRTSVMVISMLMFWL